MRWMLFFVSLGCLVGCQGSSANYNPFTPQGPALVPPPPTGSAGRTNPYYQNSLAANGAPPQARFTSQDNVADQRGTASGHHAGAAAIPAVNQTLNWQDTTPPPVAVPTTAPANTVVPATHSYGTAVPPATGAPPVGAPPVGAPPVGGLPVGGLPVANGVAPTYSDAGVSPAGYVAPPNNGNGPPPVQYQPPPSWGGTVPPANVATPPDAAGWTSPVQ